MKKLSLLLNFLTSNNINITSISFDEITSNVLILYEDVLLEINEDIFIYYHNTIIKKFLNYTIEDIIEFLNTTI